MDPNIRNFSQIEKLIKENPRQADAQAFEWQHFLKTNAQSSPELYSIGTSDEFYKWAAEHPEKNVDTSVWVGKEISEAYYYLRDQNEDSQMREDGIIDQIKVPRDLTAMPILATSFMQRPKIMEDDREYQKIEEKLKNEWLKNNPGKDFFSKEGVDYLYGALDGKTKTSLHKEAEEAFRKDPKFKERIARYNKEAKKIYRNKNSDPKMWLREHNAQQEISARLELLERRPKNASSIKMSKQEFGKYQNDIIARVNEKSREEFAQSNPEKASEYFKTTGVGMKEGDKVSEKNLASQTIQPITINAPTQGSAENSIRPPNQINAPGGGRKNRNPFKKMLGGKNLNPFGKTGTKAAGQTALKGLAGFLAANPWVWIVLGVIILFIIVFIIVFSGGFGGIPEAPSDIVNPTFTPTPPVAP
jgi:hypothetical protein